MKTSRRYKLNQGISGIFAAAFLRFVASLTVLLTLAAGTVTAAGPYYWDGNNNVAGFGAASGTWAAPTAGTTTAGWSTDATGATTVNGNSVTTGTGDALNFGTDTAGLAAGTITVSGTVNAGSLNLGSASLSITLGGSGTINLAPTATIGLTGGKDLGASFINTSPQMIIQGPVFTGAGTSLLITNGGLLRFRSGAAGWGAGATATISGDSQVYFYSATSNALGGSGGYTVNLGGATTGGSLYTGNTVVIPNNVVVTPGSGFRFIALYDNGGNSDFSGNITVHTNLYFVFGSSGSSGKTAAVTSPNGSIDSGATVTFAMGSALGDDMSDSAIWNGPGSVAYTSAALTDVSPAFTNMAASSSAYFLISGAKTYSGGASIYGFTNGSYCVVSGSSDGPPVSNGPFGTGTLTLGGDAALCASNMVDCTLGNAVALAGNVTFPTVAGESSLIFKGNVNLGSATRTLTCNVGTTVPGKLVDFQGVISGTGSAGLTMAGTGTLRLSGTNTYTGNTTVNGGTLVLVQPTLATNSTVTVSNGAVLNLEFSTTNVVAGFMTNGVSLPAGVYNSGNLSPFIAGAGSLLAGFNDHGTSLKGLVLNPAGTLSPAFSSNILTYAASEAALVTPTVTVTNADLTASNALIVNGIFVQTLTSGVASSPLTLPAGLNTIAVQVTAADGSTVRTYTVNETQMSGGLYYWDGNDGVAGFGAAGGTWSAPSAGTTTSGWSTDATGATTVNGNSVTTGTGDALNFGTATAGLAAGTITVSGTVNAGGVTYGSASQTITLSGGQITFGPTAGIVNNSANTQFINSQISGAGTSLTFDGGNVTFNSGGAGANNTTGDLYLIGGGTMLFNAANTGWGAGKHAYVANGTTVQFYAAAGDGLGGSGGYTINLGDGSTPAGISMRNSATCANSIVVPAGSGGSWISFNDNGTTPVISGNITAHDNLSISYGGIQGSKNPSVSGGACFIDAGATVSFSLSSTAIGDKLLDSAIWGGQGSISYASFAPGGSTAYFLISGAKTYSGGASLSSFDNGFAIVKGSSAGTPNNVTSGPFGTGILALGDACNLRADTNADSTLGNSLTLSGTLTFPTVASEKSLIFQGDADLGDTTPVLNVNVGSTVAGKHLAFQGVLSCDTDGVGLSLTGTGVLRLSGANTYSGDTTVGSGTLQLGNSNVIPNGAGLGDVYVNGTLDLNGYSDVINGLNGMGIVDDTLASSSATLTLGNGDAAGTFSGTIQDSGSGASLAVVKTGNGAQTLAGTNTYSGTTTVNGGALMINGSINSGGVNVIGAGTTLGGTGTIADALTMSSGGILQPTLAGTSGGTLTLSRSVSPSFAAGCTLLIRAPSATADKVVLSNPSAGFACGNLNLFIDATGLSSNLTGLTIVSAAGGISGTFASVAANNGCAVTVHYNAQSITVDLQPAPLTATKLVFTSARFTNTVGFTSGLITVQRQNNSGTPITSDRAIFVNLTSSSGTNATFNPPLLTISNGVSTATFTYSDNQSGTPTLTAASSPLTSATQQETIVPPPPPSPLDPSVLAARKLAALTYEYSHPYPSPVPGNTWGESEYCVAAYTLNMGLSTANAYVLGWNNINQMSLSNDLASANPVRIFADPTLFGRMSYAAQTNLQTIMWNYLNVNSKVADTTNVWNIAGSENHNLSMRGPYYLIAQTLAQTPGYTTRVLQDGKTIQQHAAAWATYFRNYFWSRARKGLEVEINSPTYMKYTLSSYYNVYDLTTDPVVKANAKNYLDLFWAEKAQSFLAAAGTVGGSVTRGYKERIPGDTSTSFTYFLGWNDIGYGRHPAEQIAMVTSYACPDTISALALYPKGRYLAAHSSWGQGTTQGTTAPINYIYYITFESNGSGGVVRANWTTEAYVMSATCYRPDRAFVGEANQNRLMGVHFNNSYDRIIMNGKGTTQSAGNETGYAEVNGVCGTNCLILWRDPRVTSSSTERLFLSNGNIVNNLVTNGGWQFSQTANAYVAFRIANQGWTTGTDINIGGGVMETLSDPWSPVIIECAPASDYTNNFTAFQNKILSNPFVCSTNSNGSAKTVTYTSTAGDQFVVYANSTTFPKLNGANYAYTVPQTFVSPYLNGLGTGDTGTVTYSNYAAITLSFLTNSAPTLPAISNYTLIAGQTLKFTNSATDANIPPLTLAYSLNNAPSGAVINATSGVFTWRPAIAQAPSTNTISVVVTGNNTPALSATQTFKVTVSSPATPTCSQPGFTNGVFSIQIGGSSGPDYLLQASTNLVSPLAWQTIFTTNTAPPFVFRDAAATNYPARFYRVLLGP